MEALVVIRCITYNHEPYIRDALEGFVMQKTNFPFVAIVHDDASTDRTAEIVREYAEKYPDIIKPIYEIENQYSKRDGSLGRIMNAAIEATRAKYIAYCEGDDYWTDPLKLQKQVDFLESHPDYSITFHNAKIINETQTEFRMDPLEEREYSSDEVFLKWIVPTASIVMRREALVQNKDRRIINGDIWIILSGLNHGKGYAFKDYMSIYRRHKGGVTNIRRREGGMEYIKTYIDHYQCIKESFPKLSSSAFNRIQGSIYWQLIFKRDEGIQKRIEYLCKAFYMSPKYSFKEANSFIQYEVKKFLKSHKK